MKIETRIGISGLVAVLGLTACASVETDKIEAKQTPSYTREPIDSPTPLFDPKLASPESCLGDRETVIDVQGEFSVASKGNKQIVICDLTGKGIPSNKDRIALVLKASGCKLTSEQPHSYFAYPNEAPITEILGVKDSTCLKKLFSPKNPVTV